jgi:hypothetical protein
LDDHPIDPTISNDSINQECLHNDDIDDDPKIQKVNETFKNFQSPNSLPDTKSNKWIYSLGDADWSDLTITFLVHSETDIRVRLKCKGIDAKTFSLKELNLAYKNIMNKPGVVLMAYAQQWTYQKKTKINLETVKELKIKTKGTYSNLISDIREKLRDITGKTSDPFEEGGYWKTGHQLRCTLIYNDSNYADGDDALKSYRKAHNVNDPNFSDVDTEDQGDVADIEALDDLDTDELYNRGSSFTHKRYQR